MTPKPAPAVPGSTPSKSIAAFIEAIEKLPSDTRELGGGSAEATPAFSPA